jgi:hypothetical protein
MAGYRGRIILTEESSLLYRIHEEPVSLTSSGNIESRMGVSHGLVEPSKKPVGIAHEEHELLDKTYICAKEYAEEIAKACSCVLMDRTKRGNAEHNRERESVLKRSLSDQLVISNERHRKLLREQRKRPPINYPISKNPNAAVDIGD